VEHEARRNGKEAHPPRRIRIGFRNQPHMSPAASSCGAGVDGVELVSPKTIAMTLQHAILLRNISRNLNWRQCNDYAILGREPRKNRNRAERRN